MSRADRNLESNGRGDDGYDQDLDVGADEDGFTGAAREHQESAGI
ncbi:MAG TPA: hypothetical protein VIZ63_12080 [Povalibacter sp.]